MKLITSEKAEAEVIGHIIILSITILGIGMITLFGVPAIYTLEDMANSKNVEQAFTVLDSRASRVTLGDSPLQITNIELGGGTLTVEPNSSRNPGYIFVNSSGFNFTIPMGRIKYTLDDRIVSYEGGGVWAQYPGGGTVMLSPPEFHYNGWTLTLPVINVSGNASVGGKGTAVVSVKKMATIIKYPNASAGRVNPVNGTNNVIVNVNITSDYYKSWADYARTLSYTNVSVNDKNKTAIIVLEVISPMGTFVPLPASLTIRNINMSNPEPLTNFSLNLFYTGSGCGGGVRDWSITSSGVPTLTISIEHEHGCDAIVKIEYAGLGIEEEWESSPIPEGLQMNYDLLNTSTMLTYDGSPCLTWGATCTTNSSYNIIQHYANLIGPDIIFNIDNTANKLNPTTSSLMMVYDPGPGALTYLHVTENRADVGIS